MSTPKRLYRIPSAGRIAGVCAGLADYLETDVTLVRLAWIVLSIFPGGVIGGVLAYIVVALIMPVSPATSDAGTARRLKRSVTDRKLGGVCGGLAEHFELDSTIVRVVWAILTFFPGCIILGIVAYLIAWFIIPSEPSTPTVTAVAPVA